MKKVLITGGMGFLGRYLIKILINSGRYDITISSSRNSRELVEKLPTGVKYIKLDLTNKRDIENLSYFDIVFHLAGNVRTKESDTKEKHEFINSEGTHRLLEVCTMKKIPEFIFISSCEVYGHASNEDILENSKTNPSNDYGRSKLLAEEYCRIFSDKIKIKILRPSYIYGEGINKERIFFKLINSALNEENIPFYPSNEGNDFIYVKDVAEIIYKLANLNNSSNLEIYNISSGKFTSMFEVFETIKELTRKEYLHNSFIKEEEETRRFSFSSNKIRSLGIEPRYSLKEGLADMISLMITKQKKLKNGLS